MARRRENFDFYMESLRPFEDMLILPHWSEKAAPSWFGFPVTVREAGAAGRLVRFLEARNIETRKVFAGNILRQPGYESVPHRVSGTLENSDAVMERTFFVGVYPGLTDRVREYVAASFKECLDGLGAGCA